jgi:hypothetical protein
MPKGLNLTGEKFGRLTVVAEGPRKTSPKGHPSRTWECVCVCGQRRFVTASNLRWRGQQSCGCLKIERTIECRTTHGLSGSSIFWVWAGIKARCLNPNHSAYKNYGERGITICSFISKSVTNLIAVMGERPAGEWPSGHPKWTVDRKDNELGYWCGSCEECVTKGRSLNLRWATALEQNINSRRAKLVTIGSETHTISEWSRRMHMDRNDFKKKYGVA